MARSATDRAISLLNRPSPADTVGVASWDGPTGAITTGEIGSVTAYRISISAVWPCPSSTSQLRVAGCRLISAGAGVVVALTRTPSRPAQLRPSASRPAASAAPARPALTSAMPARSQPSSRVSLVRTGSRAAEVRATDSPAPDAETAQRRSIHTVGSAPGSPSPRATDTLRAPLEPAGSPAIAASSAPATVSTDRDRIRRSAR